MRAITIHQPWASLIAMGAKQYETRDWNTRHTGPIAIHAGQFRRLRVKDCLTQPMLRLLVAHYGLDRQKLINLDTAIPWGSIIAIADLTRCIRMNDFTIAAQNDFERDLGFWEPDRFAWKLENVRELVTPIPAKGQAGFWEWPKPAHLHFMNGEIL
jgi:hypothetical protein